MKIKKTISHSEYKYYLENVEINEDRYIQMARSSSRPGDFSLMSKQVGKRNCNIIGGTDVDCCGSSAGSSTIPSLQELAINSQHGLPSNNILAIMKMCSDDPTNNDTRARVSEFIKQYLPPDEATDPLIDYFIVVFKNLHEANHVYPRGDDKIEASSDLEALLLKECNKLSPSVDRVKRIISLGSDLNALGSRGQTALMKTAYRNNYYVVKLLLDENPDLTLRDNKGRDVLHMAYARSERYFKRASIASLIILICTVTISSASCSTHPGLGKIWVNSSCAVATMSPFAAITNARQLVVP